MLITHDFERNEIIAIFLNEYAYLLKEVGRILKLFLEQTCIDSHYLIILIFLL